ncbi:type IV pilin protein [Gallaecimonas xiamenensis]|uniref:Type IV pilus biogenesis protein PilE n=1 Tax=Gallaecimonas xiamenensis 3-C-1 TaxID=745411 RepID=K2JT03_9GAMM|nr:type IV pilin protein [Gallaecimonas xiamenensis]EKE68265.1 type IV pilus biogenesis protein PilE [Gallaecimonas xiamenensis 3-C-1]
MRQQTGFTLIELMITVAVVAIIGAIAYPSYTAYIAKSNRAEAQAELMRLANLQEQYRIDHRTYTANLGLVGGSAASYSIAKGSFTIAASAARDTLTLTATASSGQVGKDPDCAVLTLNQSGQKSATNASNGSSNVCW